MAPLSKLAFFLAMAIPAFAVPAARGIASSIVPTAQGFETVPRKFIVTLKGGASKRDLESHIEWASSVHKRSLNRSTTAGVDKVWSDNFKGYSGEFDAETLEQIGDSDEVEAIEPVYVWKLYATKSQSDAPWGLGSISHRTAGSTTYLYDESAGEDTYAYVVDTGVKVDHTEFEGRAHFVYNAYPDSTDDDNFVHGTHCSGTIAGKTDGVSKKATVYGIKVFDTSDSTTEIVMDGFEWAVANITGTSGRAAKSVISMSLGGPKSTAFNTAIDAATAKGVLTVVAAGNSYSNADNYSPASATTAFTVGAVDSSNRRPTFSNYGKSLDIFAPGVDVKSAWIGSTTATDTISGTSMACPHVAGLSLYIKSLEGLSSPTDVANRLKALGTSNVVTRPGTGSPNLLAFNGISV